MRVIKCDRCMATSTVESDEWRVIEVRPLPQYVLRSYNLPVREICPRCADEFEKWWDEKRYEDNQV